VVDRSAGGFVDEVERRKREALGGQHHCAFGLIGFIADLVGEDAGGLAGEDAGRLLGSSGADLAGLGMSGGSPHHKKKDSEI
jgi:hypothetical protein